MRARHSVVHPRESRIAAIVLAACCLLGFFALLHHPVHDDAVAMAHGAVLPVNALVHAGMLFVVLVMVAWQLAIGSHFDVGAMQLLWLWLCLACVPWAWLLLRGASADGDRRVRAENDPS